MVDEKKRIKMDDNWGTPHFRKAEFASRGWTLALPDRFTFLLHQLREAPSIRLSPLGEMEMAMDQNLGTLR
jgi:hypothetical protein